MNVIILGADGKIYFSSYDEEFIGSAINTQIVMNRSTPSESLATDFIFWSKHITKPVFFEEGLTLRKFFECFLPWKEYFSLQTQVDLGAYYLEMQEEVLDSEKINNSLDYLVLSKAISFNPDRYDLITGEVSEEQAEPLYELDDGYSLSGFTTGDATAYDISKTRMQYIADIPVILNPHAVIHYGDSLPISKRIKNGDKSIKMNENTFGLRKTTEKLTFLKTSELEVSLEEMLRSFFRYIFSTPHKRDFGSKISINLSNGTANLSTELNNENTSEKTADLLSFPSSNGKKSNVTDTNKHEDNVINVQFGKKKDKDPMDLVPPGLISNINELISNMGIEQKDLGLIKIIDYAESKKSKTIETLASIPEQRVACWGLEDTTKNIT